MCRALRAVLSVLACASFLLTPTTPAQQSGDSAYQDATVSGNLYTNPKLGFSLRFPEGWTAERVEEKSAGPAASKGGILLRTTPANSKNPQLFVFFQDLRAAFLIHSEKDFLAIHKMEQEGHNFEERKPAREVTYGGTKFYRIDFQSRRKKNRTYQATCVIFRSRMLIGFGVLGMSEREVDDVARSLESVKFL